MKMNVLEIDISRSQFLKFNKDEWCNLNYFSMKSLDLNQMENLQGGKLSSFETALLLGGIGIAMAVFVPWSYATMGGVAIGTIGMAASCFN